MASNKQKLSALVGAGCCATLIAYVPQFEGRILRGYKDPIGIVTACSGHTATAVLGRPYTPHECDELLITDLLEHAAPVLKCTPDIRGAQLAAAVSFAFNVGTGAYCKSTMALKFNHGDIAGACAELSRWTKAGGKELPGLINRRQVERDLCMQGVL